MNRKKKILAADDDPAILEILTFILEDDGYEVKTTVNGRTEQMAQEFLPNLILLPKREIFRICLLKRTGKSRHFGK